MALKKKKKSNGFRVNLKNKKPKIISESQQSSGSSIKSRYLITGRLIYSIKSAILFSQILCPDKIMSM